MLSRHKVQWSIFQCLVLTKTQKSKTEQKPFSEGLKTEGAFSLFAIFCSSANQLMAAAPVSEAFTSRQIKTFQSKTGSIILELVNVDWKILRRHLALKFASVLAFYMSLSFVNIGNIGDINPAHFPQNSFKYDLWCLFTCFPSSINVTERSWKYVTALVTKNVCQNPSSRWCSSQEGSTCKQKWEVTKYKYFVTVLKNFLLWYFEYIYNLYFNTFTSVKKLSQYFYFH